MCLLGACLNSAKVFLESGPIDKEYHYALAKACFDEQKIPEGEPHPNFGLLSPHMRETFLDCLAIVKPKKGNVKNIKAALLLAHTNNLDPATYPIVKHLKRAIH